MKHPPADAFKPVRIKGTQGFVVHVASIRLEDGGQAVIGAPSSAEVKKIWERFTTAPLDTEAIQRLILIQAD